MGKCRERRQEAVKRSRGRGEERPEKRGKKREYIWKARGIRENE
jgi:hypothetical protein